MIAPAIAQAETKLSIETEGVRQQLSAAARLPGPSGLGDQALLRRRAAASPPSAVGAAGIAPAAVHESIATAGRPLEPVVHSAFSPRFGWDFAGVCVHMDAQAACSARDVGAAAYTVGSDIVIGEGAYAPATPDGLRLIAHERAHVVRSSGAPGRNRQYGARH